MTIDEISKYAKTGSLPADKELTCPERCLFHALKNLYDQFREKKITAEQGDKEKKTALMQFQRDVFEYQRDKELIQHHAKLWGQIELSASAYRKNPTIKNADAFLAAVYSCNGDMPMTLDGIKTEFNGKDKELERSCQTCCYQGDHDMDTCGTCDYQDSLLKKEGKTPRLCMWKPNNKKNDAITLFLHNGVLEGGFTTDKAIEVTVCDFDSDIDDESAENSYWDECKKSGMQQFAPYIYHPQKQD